MADSPKDAQLSPIAVLDGQPHWELAASSVFYPLIVETQGREFEIQVELAQPYSFDLLKEALSLAKPSVRRLGRRSDSIPGDLAGFGALTDSCFKGLLGTSSTNIEEQKRYLDQQPKLKIRCTRDTLGGLELQQTFPEDAGEELLPLALDIDGGTILLRQELYDPAARKKVTVEMSHRFHPETERDWKAWEKTSIQQFSSEKKAMVLIENYDKRIGLYDGLVRSIDGMCWKGKSCTEATKADWIGAVPAWHKLWTAEQLFKETRVKNG